MKTILFVFATGLCLAACKPAMLFEARKYYGKGNSLEFYPDNSYNYLVKMEGGYIYKFGKGTWRQESNKLFLKNQVLNPKELPVSIRSSSSSDPDAQLVINILPKKNLYFPHLPSTTDLLKIELVADKIIYPLKSETNVVRLQKSFDKGYFRAYYKSDVERRSEILNDTLRSQYIDLKGLENKVLSIDVDCDPQYFAQVKMPDDTLKIISDRKIKWDKIYLERSH